MKQQTNQSVIEWREVALGDFASVDSGQGAPQGEQHFNGEEIFVRAGDLNKLTNNIYVGDYCEKIDNLAIKEYRLKKYKKGSIVFPKSGMSIQTGNIAILKYDSYVVNHLAIIESSNKIDNLFLFYLLKKKGVSQLSKDDAYPSIRISDINSLTISLPFLNNSPHLETQEKIVAILEKAEQLKEKRKQALKLLDEYLKSVFNEMFVNKDFPKKSIGELCEVISGSTPSTINEEYWNGDIDWITPAELIDGDNYYYYESERKITRAGLDSASNLFPKETVMLTTRAPIGKVAIAGKEMCTNQGFKNMICKKELNNIYLYCWLLFNKDYLNSLGVGATFKEVSKKMVERIGVPLPPISLQQTFASIVEHVEKLKETQKKSLQDIEQLFNVLMQKAFNGELVK